MKTKNLVTLAIALVLTVLLTVLCVTGVQLGKNIVIPALDGATKGGDFADASYIVYTLKVPAAEETADEAENAAEETSDEAGAPAEEPAEETEAPVEADFAALAEDAYQKLLGRAERQQVGGVKVTRLGENMIRVEIPTTDETAIATVRETISIPGDITFRNADGVTVLTGEHVTGAAWGYDSNTSTYTAAFQFDEEGAKLFEVATRAAIGSSIGIYQDGQLMVNVSINSAMTQGSAALSFSDASAAYAVAYALNAGHLGLDLEETASGTVPAPVSAAQFQRVMLVLGVALLAVLVALVIVHKGMGLAAAISLLLTVVCTVFFFGLVPYVTMTFATVFGLIAVVAVKLFCDLDLIGRVKRNIANGSAPRSAVSAAFGVNILRTLEFAGVTLLLALLMQYLGSAPVKGFTAALAVGSALACLLTMLVTRPLVMCAADKQLPASK